MVAAGGLDLGHVGVNRRLADERDLTGIELRYPDEQAWSGEGEFTYVQEARIIGQKIRPIDAPTAPFRAATAFLV